MGRSVVFSYGGGVQTTAILTLVAEGRLPRPELVVMADTSRERSSTWRYLEQYSKPLMEEINLPFVLAEHALATVDLHAKKGGPLLPFFTQGGKLSTFCSSEWKKCVIRRKLKRLGYGPRKPVLMWIGMSLDEVHRLRISDVKWAKNHYPLCFDVRMKRAECLAQVERFGWPQPKASSCWMCPNITDKEWLEIKQDDPDDFAQAVILERAIRSRDNGLWLHRDRKPLSEVDLQATSDADMPLFDCAGTCWT